MSATQPFRLDIYRLVHKALRRQMFDALVEFGRVDIDDPSTVARVTDTVDSLLDALRHHAKYESEHIHPAIEACRPGGSLPISTQHNQFEEVIAALEEQCQALRDPNRTDRATITSRLYRQLALFIAEYLRHMDAEEVQHNALLRLHYDDSVVNEILNNIVASLSLAELSRMQHWFGLTASPQELRAITNAMNASRC